MGGAKSKSKATLVSDTIIINETDINSLNKLVNKVAIDTIIENAKKCSASIIQKQNVQLGDIVVTGSSSATISQEQYANMDFSCLQQDVVQEAIISKMTDTLTQSLQDSSSADLLNKLNSNIQQKSKAEWGALPWGGSSTSSDLNQQIKNRITNKTKMDLRNVMETSTYATFKNSNINESIAKIIQEQNISAGKLIVTDRSTFALGQKQRADMIFKSVQSANIARTVIDEVAKMSNLKLDVQKDASATNVSETAVEQETKAGGFFEGIGKVVESVGTAIGNVFGLGSLGGMGMSLSPSLILCCCCIFLFFFMFMSGSSSGSTGTANYYGSEVPLQMQSTMPMQYQY